VKWGRSTLVVQVSSLWLEAKQARAVLQRGRVTLDETAKNSAGLAPDEVAQLRVVRADELDLNTPQTPGINRAAAPRM
jgi:hypothetical protein